MNLTALRTRLISSIAAGAIGATMLAMPAAAAPSIDIGPITPIIPNHKPCENPKWFVNHCLGDYTVDVNSKATYNTVRDGQQAKFFYLTVRNVGNSGGGTLFTTVAIDQYDIIEVERVRGDSDVTAAPVAEFDSEAMWVIEHNNLRANEWTTFRVWVGTHDYVDIGAHTNHHARIEYLGTPGPADYALPEQTHKNNTDFDGA
jgi:hypothetical protein